MSRKTDPEVAAEAIPVNSEKSISQKALAKLLNLSPATVSLVINESPVAEAIPQSTRDRVLEAARLHNCRPNHAARSLRKQRSFTIGVVVPEVSEGYAALVMSGIEDHLLQSGYFYFVVSHRHKKKLLEDYAQLLIGRSVDGLIAVDTPCSGHLTVPVVSVSGHDNVPGVTNIVLNQRRAVFLALEHLVQLGHRNVAFIKGQGFSSDTKSRWDAILEAARELGLKVDLRLRGQLEGESSSPEVGYRVTKKLLAGGRAFTALFAFNDISAIGAMKAVREANLRVPQDISVVGFDDIQSAAYQNPSLTTVRQPLRKMGEIAAQTLLQRISATGSDLYEKLIVLDPELVIRSSTARASSRKE